MTIHNAHLDRRAAGRPSGASGAVRRRPPWARARTIFLVLAGAGAAGIARAEGDPAAAGLAIARRADAANSGYGAEAAKVTLQLVNAHGDVTRREMVLETLEGKTDGDRSRAVFEWPADVKGAKLLIWSHKDRDDDRWLYLPAVKRVKRISAANKTGSFMGSEFAYEDFSSPEVERFSYRLVDEPTEAGRPTWRVERRAVAGDSGYARQVVWIDKQHLNPLRMDYFDRKNELLKTALFTGYRRLGAHWRVETITMNNVQTRKKSVLVWKERQLGIALPAQRFDSARMED